MLRRRREGRTNYRKRLKLLLSRKTRCVVRLTSKHSIVQFVDYSESKDFVRTGATSKELVKFGWDKSTSNVTAAYLAGYLAGVKARKIGISEAILDSGFHNPNISERLKACVKGVIESGIFVPFDLKVDEERMKGAHINGTELFKTVKGKIGEVVKQ